MPNGPVPRNRVPIKGAPDEDDESDSPDEPVFTRQDDEILLKMKEEIVKAQNEKLVYRKIQKQVGLFCPRLL